MDAHPAQAHAGYEVLWLQHGHAGIATQSVVESSSRSTANQGRLGRELFIDKVWTGSASRRHNGWQMRAIRDGVDWTRPVHQWTTAVAGSAHHVKRSRCGSDLSRRASGQLVRCSRPRLDLEVQVRGRRGELVSFRYGSMNDDNHTSWCHTRWRPCSATPQCRASRRRALPPSVGRRCRIPFLEREVIVVADEHVDPEFERAQQSHSGPRPNDFEIACAISSRCHDARYQAGSSTPEPNSTAWTASSAGQGP